MTMAVVTAPILLKNPPDLMRKLLFLLLISASSFLFAQETEEEIYLHAEQMPVFPSCAIDSFSVAEQKKCSDAQLMQFIYQNIQYPFQAREEGIEGTVVVSFVINKEGSVEDATVVKDIGGGCGEEVLRIINGMNEINLKWKAAFHEGKTVAVKQTLPVKFKLEQPKDYQIVGADTIYLFNLSSNPQFKGGSEAFLQFFEEKHTPLKTDSCYIGHFDVELYVNKEGLIYINSITDYCNLGFDHQFELIKTINATNGMWEAALYEDNKVTAPFTQEVILYSSEEKCSTMRENYYRAIELSKEASVLYEDETQHETAFAKMDEAIGLSPNNAELYFTRGIMRINQNEIEGACTDAQKAKELLGSASTSMDQVFSIICSGF